MFDGEDSEEMLESFSQIRPDPFQPQPNPSHLADQLRTMAEQQSRAATNLPSNPEGSPFKMSQLYTPLSSPAPGRKRLDHQSEATASWKSSQPTLSSTTTLFDASPVPSNGRLCHLQRTSHYPSLSANSSPAPSRRRHSPSAIPSYLGCGGGGRDAAAVAPPPLAAQKLWGTGGVGGTAATNQFNGNGGKLTVDLLA